MTLAVLLAVTTGAWAQGPTVWTTAVDISQVREGHIIAGGLSLTVHSGCVISFNADRYKRDGALQTEDSGRELKDISSFGENCVITDKDDNTYTPVDEDGLDGNAWVVTEVIIAPTFTEFCLSGTYYDPPIEVTEVNPVTVSGATKQWEFDMPASDVVLTPIYAAATIYDADDAEKQAYETLKEAFAAVQDGDIIKLDWDVTLTEQLETPAIAGGAEFTLDLNGYIIDGNSGIYLNNVGDLCCSPTAARARRADTSPVTCSAKRAASSPSTPDAISSEAIPPRRSTTTALRPTARGR